MKQFGAYNQEQQEKIKLSRKQKNRLHSAIFAQPVTNQNARPRQWMGWLSLSTVAVISISISWLSWRTWLQPATADDLYETLLRTTDIHQGDRFEYREYYIENLMFNGTWDTQEIKIWTHSNSNIRVDRIINSQRFNNKHKAELISEQDQVSCNWHGKQKVRCSNMPYDWLQHLVQVGAIEEQRPREFFDDDLHTANIILENYETLGKPIINEATTHNNLAAQHVRYNSSTVFPKDYEHDAEKQYEYFIDIWFIPKHNQLLEIQFSNSNKGVYHRLILRENKVVTEIDPAEFFKLENWQQTYNAPQIIREPSFLLE